MQNNNQLKDKYVLVTGANSGIGLQIAKDFLAEGAIVAAHYYGDKEAAQELLRSVEPGRCQIFEADFSQSANVLRLWDEFIAWSKGKIDVLVNNAGEAGRPQPLEELSEEIWDKTFQVNLKAPFLLGRSALALMSKQKSGRIINISSIGVKFGGSPTTIHYSASKAALEAVTKSLAKAGAPFNVLVNAIRPGVTDTPFHQKIGRNDLTARATLIPLKRIAKPSEISNMVIFLASEKSSFVTNTVIDVAGGE
jgi:3-oxoacyl-[acyl-carrier protein] reductase